MFSIVLTWRYKKLKANFFLQSSHDLVKNHKQQKEKSKQIIKRSEY